MAEQHGAPEIAPPSCQGHSCSSDDDSTVRVYQAIVFVVPVFLAVTVILLLWFCIRHRRNAQRQTAIRLRQEFLARGLVYTTVDRGLCKIFRDTLPIAVYDESLAASLNDSRCPVCLNDFEADEKLRQLPVCGHCFHLDCIDEWIRSNSTCPVCRSTLIVTKKIVPFNSPARQAARSSELSEMEDGIQAENVLANNTSQSETIGAPDESTTIPKVVQVAANV